VERRNSQPKWGAASGIGEGFGGGGKSQERAWGKIWVSCPEGQVSVEVEVLGKRTRGKNQCCVRGTTGKKAKILSGGRKGFRR